jgi:hypothetical protein
MDPFNVALHEAAHCVGFWLCGVKVTELQAGPTGGLCQPARHPDNPEDHAITCLIGGSATALLGGGDDASGEPSVEDLGILAEGMANACETLTPRRVKALRIQADQLVCEHEEAILALASRLCQMGTMVERDLAEVVHSEAVLAAFRKLYPRPAQSHWQTAPQGQRMRQIRIVTTSFWGR